MTQKRDYEKPAVKVVEVRIESHLLAASTGGEVTNTTNWRNGDDTTDEVYF